MNGKKSVLCAWLGGGGSFIKKGMHELDLGGAMKSNWTDRRRTSTNQFWSTWPFTGLWYFPKRMDMKLIPNKYQFFGGFPNNVVSEHNFTSDGERTSAKPQDVANGWHAMVEWNHAGIVTWLLGKIINHSDFQQCLRRPIFRRGHLQAQLHPSGVRMHPETKSRPPGIK